MQGSLVAGQEVVEERVRRGGEVGTSDDEVICGRRWRIPGVWLPCRDTSTAGSLPAAVQSPTSHLIECLRTPATLLLVEALYQTSSNAQAGRNRITQAWNTSTRWIGMYTSGFRGLWSPTADFDLRFSTQIQRFWAGCICVPVTRVWRVPERSRCNQSGSIGRY